jgi:hypothetical protein
MRGWYNGALMSGVRLAALFVILCAAPVAAQAPPPRISIAALDLHGAFVKFPDTQVLADSRGLPSILDLPGAGFGGTIGLHVYPLRWKAVTFGLGGEVVGLRAHSVPSGSPTQTGATIAVTEKFLSFAPQLSLNFGSAAGWSYISGGVGLSQWSVIPDGAAPQDPDSERLATVNYGGGARWFMKRHLAFSFDVRIYSIDKGAPPSTGLPGSPHTTLMVIGAGVSLRP